MALDRFLTLCANLLPLVGVWRWNWNIFDVLILYWMQTGLLVLFTLLHITKAPEAGLGMITVNGRARPATRRDYLMIFGVMGGVFCAAHLLFLWVFFSGQLNRIVHGPVTFWQHMVIASGAWVALCSISPAGLRVISCCHHARASYAGSFDASDLPNGTRRRKISTGCSRRCSFASS
jgi:hypothetical protein